MFLGQVNCGSGTDTIELASGGNMNGTLAGLGTGFAGFENLTADAGANWQLSGSNTIGGVANHGTLVISASASLDVTSSIGAASNGTFQLQGSSVLEVAAVLGGNDKIQFLGASELIVDKAASFGTGIGKGSYVGPLLQSFGVGDQIDMKDVLSAATTLSYNQSSGILQLLSGAEQPWPACGSTPRRWVQGRWSWARTPPAMRSSAGVEEAGRDKPQNLILPKRRQIGAGFTALRLAAACPGSPCRGSARAVIASSMSLKGS